VPAVLLENLLASAVRYAEAGLQVPAFLWWLHPDKPKLLQPSEAAGDKKNESAPRDISKY